MLSLISLATSFTGLNMPTITYGGLINSPLAHHLIDHEILHVFFSLAKGPRKTRLTRAQRRKSINRRRRWFTDNIIMHHKRLHDRNREIVISSARTRVLAKKAAASAPRGESHKWRDRVESTKSRGQTLRGRIDARRARARSRWLSVQDINNERPSPNPTMFSAYSSN